MDLDLKKLRSVIKLMQKEGVLHLKTSEIELGLAPGALFPDHTKTQDATPSSSYIPTPEPSPEEILFWSSPGLDLPEEMTHG